MNEMIIWRLDPGLTRWDESRTGFRLQLTRFFPRSKQACSALIGSSATLAPTIGQTVGGYAPTRVVALAVLHHIGPASPSRRVRFALIDFDKPDLSLFKHFDWWGLGFMAAFWPLDIAVRGRATTVFRCQTHAT